MRFDIGRASETADHGPRSVGARAYTSFAGDVRQRSWRTLSPDGHPVAPFPRGRRDELW